MDNLNSEILYCDFNQDCNAFSVGTENGFRIFLLNPIKKSFDRIFDGGIGIVKMLGRSNIFALVGGGKNPKFSPKKVVIWDDHQKKIKCELKFSSEVKNIKLKRDKIIIVCEGKIYVFTIQNFQNIDIIETNDNPKGLISISSDPKISIIAYPDKSIGHVRIKNYDKNLSFFINAHESEIANLSLNYEGNLLATASDKGTLIRIFNCENGNFLYDVRRGKEKADINNISFSFSSKLLSVSSNRGTIHIFSMETALKKMKDNNFVEEEKKSEEDEIKNQTSIFKSIPNFFIGDFFKSEWSFAQVRINEKNVKCAFEEENNFINIISENGKYIKAQFDLKKGGDCEIIEKKDLFADF